TWARRLRPMSFLRACAELTRPGSRVDFGTALSRGSLRCFAPYLDKARNRRVLHFILSFQAEPCKEERKWNKAEGGEKPLLLHRSASFVAKACPRRLRPMPFLRESEAGETLE